MKFSYIIPFLLLFLLISCNQTSENNYLIYPVEIVNPLMGSDSDFSVIPEYIIGSPLFEKVRVNLPNSMTLLIESQGAGSSPYIGTASFDGKALIRSWLSQEQLLQGGKLRFDMVSEPKKKLWSSPESCPASVSARVK